MQRILFILAATTLGACFLPSGDCPGTIVVASNTESKGTSDELTTWERLPCTSNDRIACGAGLPSGATLVSCAHDPSVVATSGPAHLALRCAYQTSSSCGSSEEHHFHHHDFD
jgi:hypothetical protein